jgi:hypothetical protein
LNLFVSVLFHLQMSYINLYEPCVLYIAYFQDGQLQIVIQYILRIRIYVLLAGIILPVGGQTSALCCSQPSDLRSENGFT